MDSNVLKKVILSIIVIVIIGALVGIFFILKPKQKIEYKGYMEIVVPEIRKSKSNEYKIVTPDKYDLITLYHQKYLYYILNEPDKAWDLVPKEIKKKYQNQKDIYINYCKDLIDNKYKNTEIERYSKNKQGSKNKIVSVDKNGVKIIFYEKGIWKFEAYIVEKLSDSVPKEATTKKK